jgi:myo-inositol 2-dehydrogenase/D-chiro-inositol 1-dehydrogenase
MTRIRVVVVGCGTMGRLHAHALLRAGAELYCTDAAPEAARSFARAVGATAVADVGAAIAHGVDGAVVATPTLTHTEVLTALVEAGVPSFCEKPLALTLEETRGVGDLADARGVPVQIGFHRRCDAGYLRVRSAVRGGELGRLRIVRAGTHEAKPPMERASVAGNVLRDLQIHDFDAVRFVTGLEATGVTTVAVDPGGADGADWNCAAVVSVLEMDDGSTAVVTGVRPSPPGYDARLEAYGSAGSIAAGLDARTPMRSAGDGAVRPYGGFADRFADAYDAEMRAFHGVVADGAENPCTWRDAYAAMRIAVAAERSAHAHERVALSSVG